MLRQGRRPVKLTGMPQFATAAASSREKAAEDRTLAAIADIAAIARAGLPAAVADGLIGPLRGRFRALPDDVAVVVGRLDDG